MKTMVVLGIMAMAIGCSRHKQAASSLGISCNDGERLEPGSPLFEAFALKNFGDPSRTQGTTGAVSLELVDRPAKLTRNELMDGSILRIKVVNRIDQPVWLAARRLGDIGFEWTGKGILYGYRESDWRVSCEEFSEVQPNAAQIVSVRLGGPYVHVTGSVMTLRLVYFMLPVSVPLPPRGIVPVIGHVESEAIQIKIEPD